MKHAYLLHGWHLSYFTGKALCYLRYKEIDFTLKPMNLLTLTYTAKRRTGAAVMPILETPDGEWIQDTSVIIDRIEAVQPRHPVLPDTPVQRFASWLLEAWGDEWWVPIAMHTRWSYPENRALFRHDAGQALLPWAPRFLQDRVAERPIRFLTGMLPHVGIVPEQFETMNRWTVDMLDALDAHFAQHAFLLGERPTLGDFGLVGTMYGHLGRDPWPRRELVMPRRHLSAWLERMKNPVPHADGQLLADDALAATLAPVMHSVLHEFVPLVRDIAARVRHYAETHGVGKRLPRGLGMSTASMGGRPFRRGALSYMVWMLQRALDGYRAMTPDEQARVRDWLATQGAEDLLTLNLPRVRREALTIAVESL